MSMNDEHGCSVCKAPGTERYEQFSLGWGRKQKVLYQYDYRDTDGELFACCKPTVAECREARDNWLKRKNAH